MNTSLISKDAIICDVRRGRLDLRVKHGHACRHCARGAGCGFSVIATANSRQFSLPTEKIVPGLTRGQALRLKLPAGGLAWLAFFHYLTIPVLMTVGALLGSQGFPAAGEGVAIAGGCIGFLVGCVVLRLYDSRAGRYWLSQLVMQRLD